MSLESLRFCFAGSSDRWIFVQVLHTIFVDEQIRLSLASDSNDVFVVVLNPAANFLSVDEFYDDGSPIFGEAIDIFGLAESRFRRGLAPFSAAGVFIVGSNCHAPQYSVFDVKIQE